MTAFNGPEECGREWTKLAAVEESCEFLLGVGVFDHDIGAMCCWLGFDEGGGWILQWLESFGNQEGIP